MRGSFFGVCMDNGYVKLWRKSMSSSVFCNAELWQLWTWCLMRACHKKRFVSISTGRGESIVEVNPGQFIFGRKSCAKELNSNESSIRNRMKKLELLGVLMVNPDTHYSIVNICNWEHYQVDEQKENQPKDNQRTGKGQPKDTDKNVKNEKNVKNKCLIPENFKPSERTYEWAKEKGHNITDDDIEGFSVYHSAKGNKFVDWNSAFKKWMRNKREFSKTSSDNTPQYKRL